MRSKTVFVANRDDVRDHDGANVRVGGGDYGGNRVKVKFFFAWYDFWIGVFYNRPKQIIYICPLPCFVFELSLNRVTQKEGDHFPDLDALLKANSRSAAQAISPAARAGIVKAANEHYEKMKARNQAIIENTWDAFDNET